MAKAKPKNRSVPGTKATRNELSSEDWSVIRRFAVSLEKGRFSEYVEVLQNDKKLLWKSFVSGLGKGFGAIVGATLVVALLVGLLSLLGQWLPGELGDFFEGTSNTIENVPK